MQRQREEEDELSLGDILLGVGALAVGGAAVAGMLHFMNEEQKKKAQLSDHRSKEEYVGTEHDTRQRDADVYLFTNPTRFLPGSSAVALHHWMIVVDFEDGPCRTLEGYRSPSDAGKIYGHYTKRMPENYVNHTYLGRIFTSPYDLWECTMNNKLNGTTYNVANNNCQNWALEAAKEIDEDVFQRLSEISRVPSWVAGPAGAFHSSSYM